MRRYLPLLWISLAGCAMGPKFVSKDYHPPVRVAVLPFIELPLGFDRKRTVKANVKLLDGREGTLLWEDEKSWTTPEFHLNAKEARDAAIRQIAQRQIEKMAGTFLKVESTGMLGLV